MTNEEIKQAVEEYFEKMLKLDEDYVDNATDSWIDDAEDWFVTYWCEQHDDVTFEECCDFRQAARKKFDEIYDKQFGARDAILRLHASIQKLKVLRSDFKRDKKFFKKFPAYNNVINTTFNNLCMYMQLLSDIEEGKVESLK